MQSEIYPLIGKEVYAVNKKTKAHVKGVLINDSLSNKFQLQVMDEQVTFYKWDYSYFCAKEIEEEAKIAAIRKELSLYSHVIYSRHVTLSEETQALIWDILDQLEKASGEAVDKCRSFLSITSSYPKGNTKEERFTNCIDQVLSSTNR